MHVESLLGSGWPSGLPPSSALSLPDASQIDAWLAASDTDGPRTSWSGTLGFSSLAAQTTLTRPSIVCREDLAVEACGKKVRAPNTSWTSFDVRVMVAPSLSASDP